MFAIMTALVPLSYFWISASVGLVGLKAPQPYRPVLLAILIAFGILSFRRITDLTTAPDQASVLGLFMLIWLSHMTCVLCVEKYVLPTTPNSFGWGTAWKMLFNARWLGTEKQAPKVRSRSEFLTQQRDRSMVYDNSDQGKLLRAPKCRAFLLNRLFSFLTIYGLYWLYNHLLASSQPPLFNLVDFSPSKQTYFRRLHTVTLRETIIRGSLVFHFVWTAWAIFTGLHDILAFAFVGLGLDNPEDWPPLYGSVIQTYSMRRFWSQFWHRLVYRTYSSFGALVSRRILGAQPGNALDRVVIHFLVFFGSGVVHALVTWQLGFHCGYWEDVAWFLLNWLALLVEDGVSSAAFVVLRGRRLGSRMEKAVGYLWVFSFLFWSLPKVQYPKVYCGAS